MFASILLPLLVSFLGPAPSVPLCDRFFTVNASKYAPKAKLDTAVALRSSFPQACGAPTLPTEGAIRDLGAAVRAPFGIDRG